MTTTATQKYAGPERRSPDAELTRLVILLDKTLRDAEIAIRRGDQETALRVLELGDQVLLMWSKERLGLHG